MLQHQRKGHDHISTLPDEVLHHILSFLPTKLVVQTSILSPRWRYLWTSITNIHLDKHHHRTPHSFSDFAYRVLLFRDKSTNINKFRLHCGFNDLSLVAAWTILAISCNVTEMDLQVLTTPQKVLQEPGMRISKSIFTCKTLVVLKISISYFFQIPENVELHSLKILRLISCKRIPSEDLKRLFLGCPVLEELYFKVISIFDELDIYAPNLKKFCLFLEAIRGHNCQHRIIVNAPKLEIVNITDKHSIRYSFENFGSVVEAFVNYGARTGQHSNRIYRAHELLVGISNVKTLSLSANTMAALDSGVINKWPVFHYLTHLELAIHSYTDWKILSDLLECSPMLEVLVLGKDVVYCDYTIDEYQWYPRECVPICLVLHLKQLYMWGFDGRDDEMRLLEYMLKNAGVLENVSIYYQKLGLENETEFRRKLLMLPRSSKACEMKLSEDSFSWFSRSFSFGKKLDIWT